jgi:hypothetical protein
MRSRSCVLQQHFGAGVGVDGVVLQVQRLLRAIDQGDAAGEGGIDAVEQGEGRFAARARLRPARVHQPAECRVLRGGQGARSLALDLRGHAGAPGGPRGQREHDQQAGDERSHPRRSGDRISQDMRNHCGPL